VQGPKVPELPYLPVIEGSPHCRRIRVVSGHHSLSDKLDHLVGNLLKDRFSGIGNQFPAVERDGASHLRLSSLFGESCFPLLGHLRRIEPRMGVRGRATQGNAGQRRARKWEGIE
jgi:hypothetical protein